ncbi:MAG: DUF4097 family beta strand repeat protein, partial [Candidatus Cloacimonetes bacterium]|nr:DUF4097 family beta strand repeat protein [Candidatus Cloacimonadota bacterium]
NVIRISSDNYAKVSLRLPETKDYIYKTGDAVVKFNVEIVTIETDDGELIEFKDGAMTVTENDGSQIVEIGPEGVFVTNDDEIVEISSRGIIVETEDEDKHLTGFWGQLLGGFVKLIAKSSISVVSKDPGRLMKYLINEDHGENIGINVNFGDNDEDDGPVITRDFHDTFQPEKGSNLNVDNTNGFVRIEKWDENYIDISAVLKTREEEDEFNKLQIEILGKDGCTITTKFQEKNVRVTVNYTIKVPATVMLNNIETTNGKIHVENCRGNLNAGTTNGSIEVYNFVGDVNALSTNGRLTINDIDGKVSLSTNNGSIHVTGSPGLAKAHTSNGSIKVDMSQLENDLTLSSSNASIKLNLDKKIKADVEARTSNASIKVNDINITTEKLSDSYLRGKIGKGGKKITLTTSNGSITLGELEK